MKLFLKHPWISFLTLAIMTLLVGLFLHGYNFMARENNQLKEELHQQKLRSHKANNFYFKPEKTIEWLAQRQHPKGYFVSNPDLMDEPSQLNNNSLRATRYAVSTIATIQGLAEIDAGATRDFIMSHYHANPDSNIAGFSLTPDNKPSVRPTLDALLTLDSLQQLDADLVNLKQIKNFILSFKNPDGGFWDSHYPTPNNQSCLKCTSFAFRALGIINKHLGETFDDELIRSTKRYLAISAQQFHGSTQVTSPVDSNVYGEPHKDSYDAFRIFISTWNLHSAENDSASLPFTQGQSQAIQENLNLDDLNQQIHALYEQDNGAFSRRVGTSAPSLKATHLLIWMYDRLDKLHYIDSSRITRWVLSKRNLPGEYGGDIYSTYSAIGILTKLNVPTQPSKAPSEPKYLLELPQWVIQLLYIASFLFLAIHYWLYKKGHEEQTSTLKDKVKRDALTKLYNRHYIEEMFVQYLSAKTNFSLILIDLDFFKAVNDTHGHLVGDSVLQEFSAVLRANVRGSDVAARWGGEEFALLCPSTESRAARLLAEKLRDIIEHHEFSHGLNITASFGVSHSLSPDDAHNVFERADAALYESKETGRNKVSFR